jgi:predicted transcriptional regulator
MAKEAVFTMKLESELRDAFMAAAKRDDRSASQLVREFMRDYVQQDREYVEFLRRKVERSRASIAAGKWRSGEEVEADFRRRRQEILRNANEGDA